MSTVRPPNPGTYRPTPLIPLIPPEQVAGTILPRPLTTFVGRERQITESGDLLRRDDVRLLTLAGPGGVGKSRLALEVMQRAAAAFTDGITFVPLAPLHDSALVLPTVASAVGVRDSGGASLVDRLAMDLPNVRASLTWTLEHDAGETALRLVRDLGRFWYSRGYHGEDERWLQLALERDGGGTVRADVLFHAATRASLRESTASASLASESLAISQAHGYSFGSAGVACSRNSVGMEWRFRSSGRARGGSAWTNARTRSAVLDRSGAREPCGRKHMAG